MAPSPWAAVLRNAQTPIETDSPSVWAPIPEQPLEQSDTRSGHVVNHFGEGPSAPMTPAIKAHLADASPVDQNIAYAQGELQKTREREARPWGFAGAPPSDEFPNGLAPNHNTKLGKLAHVFAQVGNIAGNIVAPDVMARIPETQLGMKAKESQFAKRLDEEEKNKALEQEQGATTAHLNAETPEVAPNAASQRALQGAQESNLESETKMREHPLPEYSPLQFLTPEGQATEMEKHSGAITPVGPEGLRYGRVQDKFQHVNGTVNGVPTAAFADPLNHAYVDQNGNPIPNFKPMPQAAMMGPIVVSPEGQVTRATPGKTLPEGFRTVSQGGSQNIPTTQMRNMGEMAATIEPMMNTVIGEVQQMAQHLGPAVGRWNQLMVNKGGTDFPEFAGLDTDLDLLASAIVRTHFGARGGQQYREELRKQFGEAQSPQDLINRVQHAEGWIQGYARAGGVKTPPAQSNGAPPPGAKIVRFEDIR